MRRLISVALTALMILSLFTVGAFSTTVSAADATGSVEAGYKPEGTPISSEAEFLAMNADGKYYLNADITVSASYAEEFKGTFDGNGKTITVSASLFEVVNGATIKNVKTVGEIDVSAILEDELKKNCGAIAKDSIDATFENILNEATIKGCPTGQEFRKWDDENMEYVYEYHNISTGGIVGEAFGNSTFDHCENTGDVTGLSAAGIVGRLNRVEVEGVDENGDPTIDKLPALATVKFCTNSGRITDEDCFPTTAVNESGATVNKVTGNGGGIVARAEIDTLYIEDCENYGAVLFDQPGPRVGGIIGYSSQTDNNTPDFVYLTRCRNEGQVRGWDQCGGIGGWVRCNAYVTYCQNSGAVSSNNNYAGGICARIGSNTGNQFIKTSYEYCVNSGDVTGHRQYAGGIASYTANNTNFLYCFNSGTCTGEDVFSTQTSAIDPSDAQNHNMIAAGICCNTARVANFIGCVNTGTLIGNEMVGGICGRTSGSGISGYSIFFSCYTTGLVEKVTNPTFVTYYSDANAGGILGYSYGSGTTAYPMIVGCGSTADVKGGEGIACGIMGYANTGALFIQNNYFAGTTEVDTSPEVLAALWPHNITTVDMSLQSRTYAICWEDRCECESVMMNYILDTYVGDISFINGVNTPVTGYTLLCTQEDLASGKIAFELNEDFGEVYFYQRLGTDKYPLQNFEAYFEEAYKYNVAFDEASGKYVNVEIDPSQTTEPEGEGEESTTGNNGGSNNNNTQITTKPPITAAPDPEKPDDDKKGGCSSSVAFSVAVLAVALIAPAGIMLKKKED